jgi:hypothetical protein
MKSAIRCTGCGAGAGGCTTDCDESSRDALAELTAAAADEHRPQSVTDVAAAWLSVVRLTARVLPPQSATSIMSRIAKSALPAKRADFVPRGCSELRFRFMVKLLSFGPSLLMSELHLEHAERRFKAYCQTERNDVHVGIRAREERVSTRV